MAHELFLTLSSKEFPNGPIPTIDGRKTSSLLFFAAAILMNLKKVEGKERFLLNSVDAAGLFDDRV
jgi:hypothetical protein